jgi:hypothetical protein
MNKNPKKEKIVNREDDSIINREDDNGMIQIDAKISAATAEKKEKKDNKKQKLTMDDLKGKKVDGDPELESDQPIDQVY